MRDERGIFKKRIKRIILQQLSQLPYHLEAVLRMMYGWLMHINREAAIETQAGKMVTVWAESHRRPKYVNIVVQCDLNFIACHPIVVRLSLGLNCELVPRT